MTEIIGFIVSNYVWFLIGSIIILLAIIGSYADKTNFGQGKSDDNLKEGNKIIEQNSNVLSKDEINKKFTMNLSNNNVDDMNSQNFMVNNSTNPAVQNNSESINIQQGNDLKNNLNDQILINKKNEDNNISSQTTSENIMSNLSVPENNLKLDSENIKDSLLDVSEKEVNKNFKKNSEMLFDKFDKEFDAIVPKKEIIDDNLLEDINSLSLDKKQDFSFNSIPNLKEVNLPKISELKKEDNIWKF